MRGVAALPIELAKPVMLAPGGYHIMLMGLKRTLEQGDRFPVTLSFVKAGASDGHGDMSGMGRYTGAKAARGSPDNQ